MNLPIASVGSGVELRQDAHWTVTARRVESETGVPTQLAAEWFRLAVIAFDVEAERESRMPLAVGDFVLLAVLSGHHLGYRVGTKFLGWRTFLAHGDTFDSLACAVLLLADGLVAVAATE